MQILTLLFLLLISVTLECASNPCVYGDCLEGINRFDCECDLGYVGAKCDQGTICYSILGSNPALSFKFQRNEMYLPRSLLKQ